MPNVFWLLNLTWFLICVQRAKVPHASETYGLTSKTRRPRLAGNIRRAFWSLRRGFSAVCFSVLLLRYSPSKAVLLLLRSEALEILMKKTYEKPTLLRRVKLPAITAMVTTSEELPQLPQAPV
jgi:hypothetical protein